MKRLLGLIVVLALGWSGWWVVGWWGVRGGWTSWFEARQADGWVAEYDDMAVLGFPNRFDTTFTELSLADPASGLAWSAPFFQVFALSYRPNHVIAVWPHEQTFATPLQSITLVTGDMRASAVVGTDASLPLDHTNLVIENAGLVSDAGWTSAADALRFALRRDGPQPNSYRLAFVADAFAPPATLRDGGESPLPQALDVLRVDMTAVFTAPWDRYAIETSRPKVTAIDLHKAEARWGELHFEAAGQVDVDDAGRATGEITVRLTNWRDIIALMRASGQVSDGVVDAVEKGLELLAGVSGNAKTLDVPLTFDQGIARVSFIPLGKVPPLILR